jgi:hypothetical protein
MLLYILKNMQMLLISRRSAHCHIAFRVALLLPPDGLAGKYFTYYEIIMYEVGMTSNGIKSIRYCVKITHCLDVKQMKEGGENFVMKSFTICTLH